MLRPLSVKVPFLRYQLAVAVVEVGANSEDKSYPVANHLLTPEGLGLPDTVFSSLEVISIGSHTYHPPSYTYNLHHSASQQYND